jgi:hypothetical protein
MTQEALKLALDFVETVHVGEWVGSIERQLEVITAIKEVLAQPEQEPVALKTLLKWDDDIDPIGEVVGFIEGSPYIMVKVHKGKQVSLDDDLYATPPQRNEQCNYPDCKCPTENPCLKKLAQTEQEPLKIFQYNCTCGRTMKFESVHGVVAPQRTEQNFCSRCGKRVGGIDSIHTCTPPMEMNT